MNEGVQVEIEDGFARIEFLDKSKRGAVLAELLRVGGPGLIDVDTGGTRKTYIVPESVAIDAGLIEPPKPKRTTTRKAAAEKAATETKSAE